MKQTYLFCLLFVSLFSNAQIINFPDIVFKTKLKAWGNVKDINGNNFVLDANNNGEIEVSEALNVYEIIASGSSGGNIFSDATGIQYFTNVKKINFSNNFLASLNVSNMVNLEELKCIQNQITSINLTGLLNLKKLECTYNRLTSLDLSNLNNLQIVYCSQNSILDLNISNLQNLQQLYAGSIGSYIPNRYEKITLTNLPSLVTLNCGGGALTDGINELNMSNLNNLQTIECPLSAITTIDVSMLPNIQMVNVNDCRNLISIFAKNGRDETLGFGYPTQQYGSSIRYICADESQLAAVQSSINWPGNNVLNCHVNTYCSFIPGGSYNTVQGQNKLDNENDGCGIDDNPFPNLKYSVNNGTTTEYFISNGSGNYVIPNINGTYTITPILENPSYYTVTPTNLVVNFPAQTSPVNQNFCVAIIPHNDVEVSIIPINIARPGFDAKYKIIYKNKGNQIENGIINLQFNDAILDLVSTNPAFTTQTLNNLSFNYSNLNPFETREISVILNVNSPMETPAVNSGDILSYTATNTITNTDEMLSDNTFVFNQTVVNSFDPNDKTCLQGNYVGADKIGNYVHYIIRFENTGTFPAQNIVVKDMIDTAKFDVSSLVPLHASHNYFTRIAGNKVEFIFENINLPFDDANNDGYIAFKIKTLPNLVLGDTFSNSANIYFDYNFPIVTNTATTTISALNNPSFEFGNYFSLYPNPTSNELNINLKKSVEINSIQIYNTLGQLVTVQTGNALKIDVSHLKTGNYFIKINTNEGYSTSQFIKE
ncbi:DUF7619 domain-containing protein [Flavobacterium urocaniciphilum]|nr:T9SS type A sorting domain-containing protein [Flavobacterium urocaniciphilum]